jgi:hypothetical protein
MPKPKIDVRKLDQMLRSGKSQRECAQVFGVTEGAISKARKHLNVNVVKNVCLENAHRVVNKNLDAIEQLQKINGQANKIINDLSESSDNADRGLILKACREIRNQLSLQLEIFKTLYDMEAVQEFQQEVLTIIGEASPDVRNLIIDRLNKKRAIRRVINFD